MHNLGRAIEFGTVFLSGNAAYQELPHGNQLFVRRDHAVSLGCIIILK